MSDLKRTSLYNEHTGLKARMVPFGGWEMPVQYAGLVTEHEAVRNNAGLFDVSHMGEFMVSGENAREFLNHLTTNDVSKMTDGRCQYTLMCYPNGTVVDDLIISQISSNKFLAVVNACNIDKDFDWMTKHKPDGVELQNISDEWGLIALQGPQSPSVMKAVFGETFNDLGYYHFCERAYQGQEVLVFRTGYTGEDGFELMVPQSLSAGLWQQLLEQGQPYGIQPAGLGARDTLRLEAAYSLYGHEINDSINPLEAKLGWVVKLSKQDFVGKDSLQAVKEQGPKRRLVGFEMVDSGIARDGCLIYSGDREVGFVTSGTYSPTLKKAVGLALVDAALPQEDLEFFIDIRSKRKQARVVKTPFYKRA